MEESKRAGQILADAPSRVAVHEEEDAGLIVSKAVDLELPDVVGGIDDQGLAHALVPEGEQETPRRHGLDR
jgi:hypothetical protein